MNSCIYTFLTVLYLSNVKVIYGASSAESVPTQKLYSKDYVGGDGSAEIVEGKHKNVLNHQLSGEKAGYEDSFENSRLDELPLDDTKYKQPYVVPDMTAFFGVNQHYKIPENFISFDRRSLPYSKKDYVANAEAENKFDRVVNAHLQAREAEDELIPVKTPPEFVLSIAHQSALLEAAKPRNPSEDIIKQDILRSGNYWNDVWQEDVDIDVLRSKRNKKKQPIKVEIRPGSKLYDLVTILKKISPRLLYVINKDN